MNKEEALSPALNMVVLEQIHGYKEPVSWGFCTLGAGKPEVLTDVTVLSYYT